MGYKKLDEVMELLNDELDGFNKALIKLEKMTKNIDGIKIRPDTTQIEYLLKEHLNSQENQTSRLWESVHDLKGQIAKARLVPKVQLWLHYTIWIVSLFLIGYLAFKVSQINDIQERAFSEGEQRTISNLKEYFDQYPEQYNSYRAWVMEKDSVPNRK
ncbi:hypothetical protein K8352_19170 [Flavobacteriaceae bacterium F89]|uniref:Uncharacterized protein n=1 Tax=Cerina litoralis TaxID=2874477 RepID=A0AAE3F065_9FLAO|nr:DUF6730 family protein [Cerina litoralis]MCG2462892.1 hypothetical protein [Cerina litoralis]